MRWEDLFRDLEAQLDEADRAELAAEVADRARHEFAQLRLVDRLRPARGHPLRLLVLGVGPVSGRLVRLGSDWLLLEDSAARPVLVPLDAVLGVTGLGRRSSAPGTEGAVAARLRLGSVLRGLVRDRRAVTVHLRDGSALPGTLDRVGADHVELAEHPHGEPRRPGAVRQAWVVPFGGIGAVRGT